MIEYSVYNEVDFDFLSGMNLTAVFYHLILSLWGMSLNGFIAYVIVAVKQLRNQTRYILLLGMIVGNMLIFSQIGYVYCFF